MTNAERIMACRGLVHVFHTREGHRVEVIHSMDKKTFSIDMFTHDGELILDEESDLLVINNLDLV